MTPAEGRPDPATTPIPRTDRRRLLRGVAVGGLALPLLAACGSSEGDEDDTSSGSTSSGSGPVTVAAADVPVGGGTILTAAEVVVTQPTKGAYQAFSAICTHQGCPVDKIVDGKIECPCHGSTFSIKDGSPQSGPAQKPLAAKKVAVSGGQISVT